MRRIKQSEFVRHAVEKAVLRYPSFQMAWDQGILWQLERASLEDAVFLPGTDPRVGVLEVNAWRPAGLPVMRIGFIETADGLEIIRLALLSK
jgi:hypothetical protein